MMYRRVSCLYSIIIIHHLARHFNADMVVMVKVTTKKSSDRAETIVIVGVSKPICRRRVVSLDRPCFEAPSETKQQPARSPSWI